MGEKSKGKKLLQICIDGHPRRLLSRSAPIESRISRRFFGYHVHSGLGYELTLLSGQIGLNRLRFGLENHVWLGTADGTVWQYVMPDSMNSTFVRQK